MKGIEYGLRYRYAPETFWATYFGKPIDISKADSMVAYNASCGRKKEVEDELKKIIRKNNNKPNMCTIGFCSADNPKHYFFSHQLAVRDDNLADKLMVMKLLKSQLMKDGCRVETSSTAQLNGAFEVENVEKNYETVNIARPVKIYFV